MEAGGLSIEMVNAEGTREGDGSVEEEETPSSWVSTGWDLWWLVELGTKQVKVALSLPSLIRICSCICMLLPSFPTYKS
jgi:hypothetical protein